MEMYQAGQDLQDYMNKNKVTPFKVLLSRTESSIFTSLRFLDLKIYAYNKTFLANKNSKIMLTTRK